MPHALFGKVPFLAHTSMGHPGLGRMLQSIILFAESLCMPCDIWQGHVHHLGKTI